MAGDVNRKILVLKINILDIKFINLIHLQKNGKIYQIGVKSSEPRLSRDLTSALIEELDGIKPKIISHKLKRLKSLLKVD